MLARRIARLLASFVVPAAPPWYSPSAEGFPKQFADLHVLRVAKDDSLGNLANACWGSLFVLAHHIVVRRRVGDKFLGWYFPMYYFQDSCILAWPAIVHEFVQDKKPRVFFTPAPAQWVGDVQDLFLACAEPDQREAISTVWRSPLWQWQKYGRTPRHQWGGVWRPVAFPSGERAPILEVALRNAFWRMERSQLVPLAQRLHIAIPAGTDLFTLPQAMVQHILPDISEENILSIMAKRLGHMPPSTTEMDQLLETDTIHWCFGKDDHEELKSDLKRAENKVAAQSDFKRKYIERKREVSFELAKASGAKRKKRGASSNNAPPQIPEGEVSQAAARQLIPPGCHIWRSNADGGWCGHYAPYRRTAFSRIVYGHKGAFLQQLWDLWAKHCEYTGMHKADVPVHACGCRFFALVVVVPLCMCVCVCTQFGSMLVCGFAIATSLLVDWMAFGRAHRELVFLGWTCNGPRRIVRSDGRISPLGTLPSCPAWPKLVRRRDAQHRHACAMWGVEHLFSFVFAWGLELRAWCILLAVAHWGARLSYRCTKGLGRLAPASLSKTPSAFRRPLLPCGNDYTWLT